MLWWGQWLLRDGDCSHRNRQNPRAAILVLLHFPRPHILVAEIPVCESGQKGYEADEQQLPVAVHNRIWLLLLPVSPKALCYPCPAKIESHASIWIVYHAEHYPNLKHHPLNPGH